MHRLCMALFAVLDLGSSQKSFRLEKPQASVNQKKKKKFRPAYKRVIQVTSGPSEIDKGLRSITLYHT